MSDEPANASEFDRFEALAKKLVAVPKAEIDKARKKAKQQTARRRAHRASS
jgi:hypothetical protein